MGRIKTALTGRSNISNNLEIVTHLGVQFELNLDVSNERGYNCRQLADWPIPQGKK